MASLFKVAAATLNQKKCELTIEALGNRGLGWSGAGFEPAELRATREWLRSKGNSIEGGTTEVNLNVIAKRVLGLRDHQ
jgi:alkylation response protein AidB-like acyl-CoA dehydrogenase